MKKEYLKERAYTIIKAKIVNCEYPPGSFLNEIKLIEEIGTSRTPIREAMSKLEHENLVKIIPKKGVLVSSFSLSEINEVYQVRKLVEPFIIRTWGCEIDPQGLEAYRVRLKEMASESSDVEKILLDDSLHRFLIASNKNKYFVYLLDLVYDQNNRIRIISGKLTRRLEDTREEHLSIIDRLLDGHSDAAAKAMLEHLENSQKAALESINKPY